MQQPVDIMRMYVCFDQAQNILSHKLKRLFWCSANFIKDSLHFMMNVHSMETGPLFFAPN